MDLFSNIYQIHPSINIQLFYLFYSTATSVSIGGISDAPSTALPTESAPSTGTNAGKCIIIIHICFIHVYI